MPDEGSANARILDRLLEHQIDLFRIAAGDQKKVLRLLAALERDVLQRIERGDTHALRSLLAELRERIDDVYRQIVAAMVDPELIATEAAVVARIVNQSIGVSLMHGTLPDSVLAVLTRDASAILGAPAKEWWAQQSRSLAFRVAQQVRLGVASGETTAKIVARVRGAELFRSNAAGARAIVQTAVQSTANLARLESFRRNSAVIKGVMQVSTLDSRTSDVCIAYSGGTWDLDGKPVLGTKLPFNGGPPRHINCRSVLTAITKSWKELGIDLPETAPGTRASVDGQVPASMTYHQWLHGRGTAQQDQILGAGKASLWRSGKISLMEIVDQRGNPMTLAELRAKHKL